MAAPSVGAPHYEAPPAAPPAAPGVEARRQGGDATLTVEVSEDARIVVNDRETSSTGAVRRYVSRGLSSDHDYTYEVRAEVERDGQKIEETKTVTLRGGQTAQLAFDLRAQEAPLTSLTVHVPEDATVYLAGVKTVAEGDARTFTTTRLGEGQSWSDYAVTVELQRDGRTLRDERVISLSAGETRELQFDFDAPQLADVR